MDHIIPANKRGFVHMSPKNSPQQSDGRGSDCCECILSDTSLGRSESCDRTIWNRLNCARFGRRFRWTRKGPRLWLGLLWWMKEQLCRATRHHKSPNGMTSDSC